MSIISLNSGDAYLEGTLGDRRLVLTVLDPAGAPADLTGVDLTFVAKRNRDSLLHAIEKVTPTEIEIDTDPTTGKAYINLDPTDTDIMAGRYLWELQGTDDAGPVTLSSGLLFVYVDLIEPS